MSQERIDMTNIRKKLQLIPSWANFDVCELRSTNKVTPVDALKWTFSRDYISALIWYGAPSNFYTRYILTKAC